MSDHDTEAPAAPHPGMGGSYIRHPDGRLEREEWTEGPNAEVFAPGPGAAAAAAAPAALAVEPPAGAEPAAGAEPQRAKGRR